MAELGKILYLDLMEKFKYNQKKLKPLREMDVSKCMSKMENFAGSRKVANILKVCSLLSPKIPISSKSVESSSVMSHSPAAPPVYANPAQIFF
jgi:hypothetical protein